MKHLALLVAVLVLIFVLAWGVQKNRPQEQPFAQNPMKLETGYLVCAIEFGVSVTTRECYYELGQEPVLPSNFGQFE